jgi:hypothetical protein
MTMPTVSTFELLLFSTDVATVQAGAAAGIDAVIIDWERRGKGARQRGANTEIREDTFDDLCRVRRASEVRVICRINGVGGSTHEEVEHAIDGGANEILVPMVRSVRDVETVLDLVRGQVGVGILIETVAGVEQAAAFARLPLVRVFVGLNDLAIERKTPNIFTAVTDGTVGALRQHFSVPFGFGGLTRPGGGHPIPCRLLMGEMARLDCQFSFLRRSFLRDLRDGSMDERVAEIRRGLAEAWLRTEDQIAHDRAALASAVVDTSL